MPEGLEKIGAQAFYDCRGFYGELHLPNSLKQIGHGAFSGCIGLTGSLTIPQGITKIEEFLGFDKILVKDTSDYCPDFSINKKNNAHFRVHYLLIIHQILLYKNLFQ